MTRYAALLVGLVMIVLGALSYFAPPLALQGVQYFHEGLRVYVAAGVRLTVGLLLVGAARQSRAPWLMYFLGGFTLLSALLTPFMKRPLADVLLGHFFGGYAKPWAAAVSVLGMLVVYAVVPPRDIDME